MTSAREQNGIRLVRKTIRGIREVQSGRMGQQVPDRRRAMRIFRQVSLHGRVELDRSIAHQPEHRSGSNRFGERAAVGLGVGRECAARERIGKAIAARKTNAVLRTHHHGTAELALICQPLKGRVQPRGLLGGGRRGGRDRGGRHRRGGAERLQDQAYPHRSRIAVPPGPANGRPFQIAQPALRCLARPSTIWLARS